ncbi:MAG: phosphatase PAP2 family protein [Deltaproteobacteria bacterium]|nr:phosphatase PAP2 family protein [Deltaproteobacteria bacterium]
MMTLPLFITKDNRVSMALLCGVAFFFGYSLPNHYHLFPPQQLPLTPLDRAIPLMPWTILVYTSEYYLFVSAYFLFREELTRNKYIWSYFGVLFLGALFFIFFPTTYPRADWPLPTDTHPLIYRIFSSLREADDPSNCFPSMHVTCCYITAYAFLHKGESRWHFWIYFLWSTAIAMSTLPTKQHYIVDVIGGLTLSAAGYWFFFKKIRYVPLNELIPFKRDNQARMADR